MALFSRGAPDLIAAFSRWADHQMLERLAEIPGRAGRLVPPRGIGDAAALCVLAPWREAVRRGLSVLAMPPNALLGLRLLYDHGRRDLAWGRRRFDRFQLLYQARDPGRIYAARCSSGSTTARPILPIRRRLRAPARRFARLTGLREAPGHWRRRPAEPVPSGAPI